MARETKAFCSWGMYAFTEVLQAAWISLYKSLIPELISYSELEEQLRFNTDEATLRDQNLFIGQTCGYPLIKCYQGILEPLCVPVFDVNGCDDTQYRSVIIVPKQSDYQSLEDCAGKTVIINGTDSNSGMNLLRAAVNPLREGNTYFGSTLLSGSHLASLQAVAAGRADIAAIDCVTFALISEATPILANRVRVIGYTEPTTGLPFVVPTHRAKNLSAETATNLFNKALSKLSRAHRDALHISSFKKVTVEDYRTIVEMERTAQHTGHSENML